MDILDAIGDFGRFQKETFLLISIRSMILSFAFYVIHMSTSNVEHWCSPVDSLGNITDVEWKQCCIPKDSGKYSQCQRYQISNTGVVQNDTLVNCPEWQYDKTTEKSSLKSEFNLVCDRKWLVSMLYASFFTGNLISYPFAGYISDRFGRRRTILIGLVGLLVFNSALAGTSPVEMFMVCRFLSGLFYPFVQNSTITLFLEISGKKQRGLVSLYTTGTWNLTACLALLIFIFLKDWRLFIMVGSFPLIIPYLLLCWKFLPESPRWLIATHKYDKAKEVLQRAANKNGIVIHDMESVIKALKEKIESGENDNSSNNAKELLYDRSLASILALVVFSYFVSNFVGNGFYVIIRNLSGNFHVDFVIASAVKIVTSILNPFLQAYVTRRRLMLFMSFFISGAGYLIITALGEDMKWFRVAVAMVSISSRTISAVALMLYLSEVVPTKMRSQGLAFCFTAGRIGSIISSFTDLLNATYGANTSYYLFGALTIFTATGYIFVPDMNNDNTPDTVAESKRNMDQKARPETREENNQTEYRALPVA